jgi:hypothetical protein
VTVLSSFTNTRVMALPVVAGVVDSIGGGPGSSGVDDPAAFFYISQGFIYRKVTSATGAGFAYTAASTYDMTTAALRTAMWKATVTDFQNLVLADGMQPGMGSGSGSGEHKFVMAGTNAKKVNLQAYPPKGGIIILPIDPNIAAYREVANSPTLTAVNYFSLITKHLASNVSKSENIGFDCIDLGTGLELHTSGALSDLIDHDEGIVTNRFGYVQTLSTDNYGCFGTMFIGRSSGATTSTSFTDTVRETYEHLDGLFQAGWSGWLFDMGNAGSAITLGNKSFKSSGTILNEDTRGTWLTIGTAGALILNDCLWENQASITLTVADTVNRPRVVNCVGIVQAGSTVTGGNFSSSPVASLTAQFLVDDISLVTTNIFNSGGSGYAVDLGNFAASEAITWNNTESGYVAGTSGTGVDDKTPTGDETIVCDIDSGFTLTINVADGASTPSVANIGLGSVDVVVGQNTLTFTLNPSITGYEWRLYEASGTPGDGTIGTVELDGEEVASADNQTYTYTYTSDQPVAIQILANGYIEYLQYETLQASNKSFTFNLTQETN